MITPATVLDALLTLQQGLEQFRKQTRGVRLAQRRRLLGQTERELRPVVGRFLRTLRTAAQKELPATIRSLQRKDRPTAKQLASGLEEKAALQEAGRTLLKPALLGGVARAGQAIVGGRIRKQEAQPLRFDPIGAAAVAWAEQHAAELVTLITLETMQAIRGLIVAALNAGVSAQAVARQLRALVGLTAPHTAAVGNQVTRWIEQGISEEQAFSMAEDYAQRLHGYRTRMIARTEAAFANDEGILEGYDVMGIQSVEWVADPEACDYCAEMSGTVHAVEEAHGLLPAHPHCLPGDSYVLPVGRITAAMKRFYNGEIIVLKTSSKNEISCTPNHPILTDSGFQPAHSVDVGDRIICHGFSQRKLLGDWKYKHRPARIQDVFSSLRESRFVSAITVPSSPFHFHGDGEGGDVDIVWPNRFLLSQFYPAGQKHLCHSRLKGRKESSERVRLMGFCAAASLLERHLSARDGKMSGPYLAPPLLSAHILPAKQCGLAVPPDMNPGMDQPSSDRSPRDSEFKGQPLFGLSIDIPFSDVLDGKADPKIFGKTTVVSKQSRRFYGHVYNIETTRSYYISDGIAIGNCECTWVMAA